MARAFKALNHKAAQGSIPGGIKSFFFKNGDLTKQKIENNNGSLEQKMFNFYAQIVVCCLG